MRVLKKRGYGNEKDNNKPGTGSFNNCNCGCAVYFYSADILKDRCNLIS